jgi:hypothetical protein
MGGLRSCKTSPVVLRVVPQRQIFLVFRSSPSRRRRRQVEDDRKTLKELWEACAAVRLALSSYASPPSEGFSWSFDHLPVEDVVSRWEITKRR